MASIFLIVFIFGVLCACTVYVVDWHNETKLNELIKGTRVVVTGASMGIGAEIAKKYASLGAKDIVIAARSVDRLTVVRNTMLTLCNNNCRVHIVPVSLSSKQSAEDLVATSVSLMGGLDYLILNHITSSHHGSWLHDHRSSSEGNSFISEMFDVNFFSYVWSATAAFDHLNKTNGAIGIVSSLAGHVGTPMFASYSATKHALHGFFGAIRAEQTHAASSSVGITLCAIGATDTEGARAVQDKMTSAVTWDPADLAAHAIVKGVALRKAEITHPFLSLSFVIWVHELFPQLADKILISVMK